MTFWNKPMPEAITTKRENLALMERKSLVEAMKDEGLPVFEFDTEADLRHLLLAEYVAGPGNMTTRRKTKKFIEEINAHILRNVMTDEEAIQWLTGEIAQAKASTWLEVIKRTEASIMRDAEPDRD